MGLKKSSLGIKTRAPTDSAAWPMPVREKQLAGSFMGLSVTTTDEAPALKHRRATSASNWGFVVAESIGGLAKAAFTLSNTRSPLLMNASMPPMAFKA